MIIQGYNQSQSIKNSNDRLNLLKKEAKQKQMSNSSTICAKRPGTELLTQKNRDAMSNWQLNLQTAIAEVDKRQKIVESSNKKMKLLDDIIECLKEIANKACEDHTDNTKISDLLKEVYAKLDSGRRV
jgi:hypothetical protein